MWAEVPSDIIDAIFDLDFFDKDREKKERDLLKDLPIGEVENLTDAMPTPFDCEKYIGKTGQELLDMGFICNGYSIYEGQDPRFFLDFGDYEYEITMNERVVDIAEDASYEELFAPRTVKSVQCDGVGHGSLDIFDDYE